MTHIYRFQIGCLATRAYSKYVLETNQRIFNYSAGQNNLRQGQVRNRVNHPLKILLVIPFQYKTH